MILNQWQPFVAVAVVLSLLLWESIAPFFSRTRRAKHVTINMVVSLLNMVVLVGVFAGATIVVADFAERRHVGVLYWAGLSGVPLIIAAFLLFDVWTYWWHRFNHVVPFFWRFHRMHHSDPEMDVSTGTRFHLGEVILSSIIRLMLIPIIGIPIGALILFDFVQLPIIYFHHANVALPSPVDRVLRLFIVTPFMHKVHHSRVRRETDSNYSSVLSVWDRVFGSYVEKEDYGEIRFGLENFDREDLQNVSGLLRTPLLQGMQR